MTKYPIEKLWQGRKSESGFFTGFVDSRVRVEILGKRFSSGVHPSIVGAIDELLKTVKETYPSAVWKLENDVEYINIPDPEELKEAERLKQIEINQAMELEVLGNIIRKAIEPAMNERGLVWVGNAVGIKKESIAFKKDRFDLKETPIFVMVVLP